MAGTLALAALGIPGIGRTRTTSLEGRVRSPRLRPNPIQPGRQIGGFHISEEIGRGSYGQIFAAVDPSGIPVIIKTASDPAHQHFLDREGDVLSAVSPRASSGSSVVQLLARGQLAGRTYLALEYIRGRNLRDLLQHGPMSLFAAVTIVYRILEGLETIHRAGYVHSDIKPENLLVEFDQGRVAKVKIVDLGAAVPISSAAPIGTIGYLSPEQSAELPVGSGSDIYSLGVTIYEMLRGGFPFLISSPQLPYDLQSITLPRLPENQFPSILCDILQNMLERDPSRRYTDCAMIRQHLSRAFPPLQTG